MQNKNVSNNILKIHLKKVKKKKKKAQSKRKGGDNKVKKSIKFKTIEKNQSNLIKFNSKLKLNSF